MSGRPLYLDNDDEPEYYVARHNTATGVEEAATGLAGLTVYLALTDVDATTSAPAAVDASLSKTVAERTEAPGQYFARYEGSDLRAQLAGVRGVYEIFGDGTNVLSSVHRRVLPARRPA